MAETSVENKIKQICKNIDQTNQIQELLEQFQADETTGIEECIDILFGVFSFHILKGTWLNSPKSAAAAPPGPDEADVSNSSLAKNMIHSWLATNFDSFLDLITQKLKGSSSQIQRKLFETFLRLVSFEHENSLVEKVNFTIRLDKILLQLMFSKISDETLIFLKDFTENLDVQYVFLKAVPDYCQREKFKTNTIATENCLKLFQLVAANQINVKEDEATLYFSQDDRKMRKRYGKVYSEAWLAYLRMKLSPILRKKILVDLDTKVIPYLSDPKELIDFLTDSYNTGGVTSLLALNGLFILINQHNLDYPDFYENLYKIIDPSIFHMKYKSRFFHYIDMFLTSTHLPAYLVAAFIKKFSRMLLFTPTTDMLMLLTFMKNLLIRHQSTKVLIHRKQNSKDSDGDGDPYIFEEDLTKCRAIESSLWEIQALSHTFSSDVKQLVASFKKDFPPSENDITDHFDVEYEDLFNSKVEKLSSQMMESGKELVPVNFIKPKEIFEHSNSGAAWVLE